MADSSTALDRVYAAESIDQLAEAYTAWSSDYDRELAALGYCLPFVATAWIARHVRKGSGPILDAGCGTGLSGPCLKALGYERIEGLDFSQEMLDLAGQRKVYTALTRATLGETLPWADGTFFAVLCTGVFTEGHAPASSLDELVRITKPGGFVVFTVRDTVLEHGSYPDVFEWLEKAERWRFVEDSAFFRPFTVGEPEVLVKAFVYEVL